MMLTKLSRSTLKLVRLSMSSRPWIITITCHFVTTGADEGAQKKQEGGEEEARGGGAEGGLRGLGRHGRHDGVLRIRRVQKELRNRLTGVLIKSY